MTVPDDYQSDEINALADYKSVSVLAVVACFAGALSLLVIITDQLIVLPLVAIALALFALFRIARSQGQLVGRGVAIAGLALGLFSIVTAFAIHFSQQQLLEQQARPWVSVYCDLVRQGKLEAACEMSHPAGLRRPLDDKLVEYYANTPPAKELLDRLREHPIVVMLGKLSSTDKVEMVGTQETAVVGSRRQLLLLCRVVPADATQPRVGFTLGLEKENGSAGLPPNWIVSNQEILPAAP